MSHAIPSLCRSNLSARDLRIKDRYHSLFTQQTGAQTIQSPTTSKLAHAAVILCSDGVQHFGAIVNAPRHAADSTREAGTGTCEVTSQRIGHIHTTTRPANPCFGSTLNLTMQLSFRVSALDE